MSDPSTLRLEPHQIPAMRHAFEEAIALLEPQLQRLEWEGFIRDPWMGDQTSSDAMDAYNSRIMTVAGGPLWSLRAYRAELVRVRDNLALMEDHYRRTEGEISDLWGRT